MISRTFVASALAETFLRHLDVTDDDGQQIIEIVRDPAGQLSHRLELLALPRGGLGLLALDDLGTKLLVRRFERCRPVGDAAVQRALPFLLAPPRLPQARRTDVEAVDDQAEQRRDGDEQNEAD